jgi:hypothetical protein
MNPSNSSNPSNPKNPTNTIDSTALFPVACNEFPCLVTIPLCTPEYIDRHFPTKKGGARNDPAFALLTSYIVQIYFLNFVRTAKKPTRPEPRWSIVDGSGTRLMLKRHLLGYVKCRPENSIMGVDI